MSLYTELRALGVPMSNHESDLYVPVTDATTQLVRLSIASTTARPFRPVPGTVPVVEGCPNGLWWDIPFAFDPWWKARTNPRA